MPKNLKEKYINEFNEFNNLLKNNELYPAKLKRYNHMEFLFFIVVYWLKKISLN